MKVCVTNRPSFILQSRVFYSLGISENLKTADEKLWLEMENEMRMSGHIF